MSLPIKLISTDFDGTLFAEFEAPPIPESLQQLIAQLQTQGVKWVINTGRDMGSLMKSLQNHEISVKPDYLVLVEREIHLHRDAQYWELQEWNQACVRAHEQLFSRVLQDVPRIADWINTRFEAQIYQDAYSPFCLIAGSLNDAEVIHEYLDDYARNIPELSIVRNDVYARFSHAAYNKGTALAELTRRLGLIPEQVFAAGDHFNDLPMLSQNYARWLAAPANAVPEVKTAVLEQRGYISEFHCGHGVADSLEHYLKTR
jgi:HAD superfamily hydrolase (TIGR01484 family)